MKTRTLIHQHQRAIDMLEEIEHAQKRRQIYVESLQGIAGEFLNLRTKYTHYIEIIDAAIVRLWERYQRILNQIGLKYL